MNDISDLFFKNEYLLFKNKGYPDNVKMLNKALNKKLIQYPDYEVWIPIELNQYVSVEKVKPTFTYISYGLLSNKGNLIKVENTLPPQGTQYKLSKINSKLNIDKLVSICFYPHTEETDVEYCKPVNPVVLTVSAPGKFFGESYIFSKIEEALRFLQKETMRVDLVKEAIKTNSRLYKFRWSYATVKDIQELSFKHVPDELKGLGNCHPQERLKFPIRMYDIAADTVIILNDMKDVKRFKLSVRRVYHCCIGVIDKYRRCLFSYMD